MHQKTSAYSRADADQFWEDAGDVLEIKINANLEYSPFNHLKIYKSYKETQNNLALGQVDSNRRSIDPMKNQL